MPLAHSNRHGEYEAKNRLLLDRRTAKGSWQLMNQKSLKITTGAMVTAIFGVMLLLNRQTGNLLEEVFLYLYPIPMVAYAAMYGMKSGTAVFAAMSLLSLLFGNFTTIFYAVSQAFIGLIFGGCLYHRVDTIKTLFAVMLLSAVMNLLNTVVLGFLFGFDLNQEAAEMQTIMNSAFEQAGIALPEGLLSSDYLKQMIVISMIILGVIQGFIVYEVSLLILRRLRFPVSRLRPVFSYHPPKWTGYVALAAFFGYNSTLLRPMENTLLQQILMTAGIFGYVYLICFGFIAVLLLFKIHVPGKKIFGVLVGVLVLLLFPFLEMVMGLMYIVSSWHERMLEQVEKMGS